MQGIRLLMALGLIVAVGLTQPLRAETNGVVGVAMPTKTSSRWIQDGKSLVAFLQERGYKADLQNAGDDVAQQVAQIDAMVAAKEKAIVVGAIDGTKLAAVLKKAGDAGIKVIAYDRLIRDTPNVDYYVTFDNFQVGVLQANSIVKGLGLSEGKGPFNIELFGGSSDDNNAFFFYNGALSVLKPYLDSGKLVVQSKQIGMDKVATQRWDGTVAQSRMDDILTQFYATTQLDAVLSPYDGISLGVINALKSAGYGTKQLKLPVVTGQDSELAAVKSIAKGEQYSTIFKDTRELAKAAAATVDAAVSGKKPEINDTTSYNNGVKFVPSLLLKPVLVDHENWESVLIGSNYYKKAQFY